MVRVPLSCTRPPRIVCMIPLPGGRGCCEPCSRTCHAGHNVKYARTSDFFCDCGSEGLCTAVVDPKCTFVNTGPAFVKQPWCARVCTAVIIVLKYWFYAILAPPAPCGCGEGAVFANHSGRRCQCVPVGCQKLYGSFSCG